MVNRHAYSKGINLLLDLLVGRVVKEGRGGSRWAQGGWRHTGGVSGAYDRVSHLPTTTLMYVLSG